MIGESTHNPSLVIFDVDGTLTQTNGVDAQCFVRAVAEEFGITGINTDWSAYNRSTDSGILDQLLHERFGRFSQPKDRTRVKTRFVGLIRQALAANPSCCLPIPGAASALASLREGREWRVAVATGGWEESGRLKLKSAGLDLDGVPLASSDDSMARERIIQTAVQRAAQTYSAQAFEKVVYVGDGVWDVRAARALNISFVGVAREGSEARLKQEGAAFILPHLQDFNNLIRTLREASVPG